MKKCSNCKLLNPPGAMRCDCGYDFATGEIQRVSGTSRPRSSANTLKAGPLTLKARSLQRSPAATAGVYSLSVLLLALGFLCKNAADAITRQQRVGSTLTSPSAQAVYNTPFAFASGLAAFIFGGIALGISWLVWHRWFKARDGSVINVGRTYGVCGRTCRLIIENSCRFVVPSHLRPSQSPYLNLATAVKDRRKRFAFFFKRP